VILLKTKRQRVDLVDLDLRLWILRLDQLVLLILRFLGLFLSWKSAFHVHCY
jgi:hypothetical protein